MYRLTIHDPKKHGAAKGGISESDIWLCLGLVAIIAPFYIVLHGVQAHLQLAEKKAEVEAKKRESVALDNLPSRLMELREIGQATRAMITQVSRKRGNRVIDTDQEHRWVSVLVTYTYSGGGADRLSCRTLSCG